MEVVLCEAISPLLEQLPVIVLIEQYVWLLTLNVTPLVTKTGPIFFYLLQVKLAILIGVIVYFKKPISIVFALQLSSKLWSDLCHCTIYSASQIWVTQIHSPEPYAERHS